MFAEGSCQIVWLIVTTLQGRCLVRNSGLAFLYLGSCIRGPLSIGGFLVVMGLASVMTGPVNREEWGKQLDVPTATTNMMIAIALAAILGYLLARGTELFVLYR